MKKVIKQQPSKWEIFNRITNELIQSNLDKYSAEQELADMFDRYWEQCWCLYQQVLLKRAFPFEKRRMGKGWYHASKQMAKDWAEFKCIDSRFCDAYYTARPTQEERLEAIKALKYEYAVKYNDLDYLNSI